MKMPNFATNEWTDIKKIVNNNFLVFYIFSKKKILFNPEIFVIGITDIGICKYVHIPYFFIIFENKNFFQSRKYCHRDYRNRDR